MPGATGFGSCFLGCEDRFALLDFFGGTVDGLMSCKGLKG